jgi:GDP-L-fucose synthase
VVKGTGKPLRQFIFAEDLARLIIWVLEEYQGNNIILSTGEKEEVSIEHVARLIAKNFDYEERIVFDSSFSDGQYKKTADNTQLISLLAESGIDIRFTPVEDGIKKSVEWFVEAINTSTARI